MAEQQAKGVVITLDSDFRIYHKHGRQVVPNTIRSVAVLRMRNGTSKSPFRLALGDSH